MHANFLKENRKESNHLIDVGEDGSMILTFILEVGTEFISLRVRPLVNMGKELSGSVQVEEFIIYRVELNNFLFHFHDE
jgi:hypothetical protein